MVSDGKGDHTVAFFIGAFFIGPFFYLPSRRSVRILCASAVKHHTLLLLMETED
jgi:hypothetical protein